MNRLHHDGNAVDLGRHDAYYLAVGQLGRHCGRGFAFASPCGRKFTLKRRHARAQVSQLA